MWIPYYSYYIHQIAAVWILSSQADGTYSPRIILKGWIGFQVFFACKGNSIKIFSSGHQKKKSFLTCTKQFCPKKLTVFPSKKKARQSSPIPNQSPVNDWRSRQWSEWRPMPKRCTRHPTAPCAQESIRPASEVQFTIFADTNLLKKWLIGSILS